MAEIGRKNAASLITALAAGQTIREAAAVAGVAERTVYRRLQDAEFQREISKIRSAMVSQALGQMMEASTLAAATLRDLLTAQSENIRLGAARSVLELGVKLRESVELENRLTVIEEQLRHEQS